MSELEKEDIKTELKQLNFLIELHSESIELAVNQLKLTIKHRSEAIVKLLNNKDNGKANKI